MIVSKSSKVWPATDRRVRVMYLALLYSGIMTETRTLSKCIILHIYTCRPSRRCAICTEGLGGFRIWKFGVCGASQPPRRHTTISRMQGHELYRRILGIEAPGTEAGGGRDPHLLGTSRHDRSAVFRVRTARRLYDHQPERQWRHLDRCQYQTILHAEPREANAGTQSVGSDVEPSSRFTALFEALAIESRKAATVGAATDPKIVPCDSILSGMGYPPATNARTAPRISGPTISRSPSRNRRIGTRSFNSGLSPVSQDWTTDPSS